MGKEVESMGNGGAVATPKQAADKNFCTLHDIELCEKGVHQIWRPDEDGNADEYLESYSMEAYYAYYYCTSCQTEWEIDYDSGVEETWRKVKEHLSENS